MLNVEKSVSTVDPPGRQIQQQRTPHTLLQESDQGISACMPEPRRPQYGLQNKSKSKAHGVQQRSFFQLDDVRQQMESIHRDHSKISTSMQCHSCLVDKRDLTSAEQDEEEVQWALVSDQICQCQQHEQEIYPYKSKLAITGALQGISCEALQISSRTLGVQGLFEIIIS
jgi:hypothetical protein